MKIVIRFVDPGELGIDTGAMAGAEVSGSACGHAYLRRPWLHSAAMVHLTRDTDDGFELRSGTGSAITSPWAVVGEAGHRPARRQCRAEGALRG